MNECRRCLHWKRVAPTWGDCYVGEARAAKHQHETCDDFSPKAIMADGVTATASPVAWVSPSGAKSSYEMPRYDLIYPPVLRLLADRLGYGAKKHGERNYEQGGGDALYWRDRANHLHEHVLKLAESTTPEDKRKHYAAILANIQILLWLDDHQPAQTGEQGHSLNP